MYVTQLLENALADLANFFYFLIRNVRPQF